jgi:MOSC domain-containing protein YiiM
MKLLSVNVSRPREVVRGGKTVTTGIFKEPVKGRVMLGALNLDGDGQADLVGHGGIFKAAYAYSIENYDYWKRELGREDLTFGQFGENFTVEVMTEDKVHIGDVFRVGGALVEVTQPRVPCYKLGLKMGLRGFEKRFLASCRVGFYLRVLEEGEVGAGDGLDRVRTDPERITVREMCHLLYFDPENLEGAKNALRIRALSPGWQQSFEERLARAGAWI